MAQFCREGRKEEQFRRKNGGLQETERVKGGKSVTSEGKVVNKRLVFWRRKG